MTIRERSAEEQSQADNSGSKIWIGRSLVILAAVLWSTSGFFAKAPTFADWPPESRGMLLAFWRSLFSAAVLIFFVRKIQWSWRLIPATAVFAAMNWTYLNSMVLCEPTLTIWLQFSAPAWVFVFSWIFFKEYPARQDWFLFTLGLSGVGLIISAEWNGGTPRGLLYGIGSGFFFAMVLLSLRWNRSFDSAWLIFLNNAVTAALFAPVLVKTQIWPHDNQWFYLIAFGCGQFAIPYLIFARAVRHVSSHEASGLVLLEPILVPIWVYIAWRHSPDYQFPATTTLIGAGLILAGLVIRYLGAFKAARVG